VQTQKGLRAFLLSLLQFFSLPSSEAVKELLKLATFEL